MHELFTIVEAKIHFSTSNNLTVTNYEKPGTRDTYSLKVKLS